jgi:Trk K+ transport system NAD-binding subunit
MNVTIIGAGNMGRGIGHRMVAGGHNVTIVDRGPEVRNENSPDGCTEARFLSAF